MIACVSRFSAVVPWFAAVVFMVGCHPSELVDTLQAASDPPSAGASAEASVPEPERKNSDAKTPNPIVIAEVDADAVALARRQALRPRARTDRPPATEVAQNSGTPSLVPFLTKPGRESDLGTDPGPAPPPVADSVRVALLLPLSGTNANLGDAMLNAAQLALFDLADERFELLPYDTQGTPAMAADAAALAIADGASVILGPLLSTSVSAVAPAGRAANVPIVAFSSDQSVAGNGVYIMGFVPEAEVDRVVRYARARGVVRFAALVPDNVYGRTVVDALQASVVSSARIVTQVRYYDPWTEDLASVVRQFANYEDRRQNLMAQRAELEARGDEIARRALARLEALETLGGLPFEALLLADGGERLQAIAAHLPFYDIDPARVRMLGTGQWDEPGLGTEPALVGGWYAAPPPADREAFVREYSRAYGQTPPRLATLAYDATALAAVLARSADGPDFSGDAIGNPSGFAGRDGIFRFRPDGVAERGLAVLQVTRGIADVISEAPRTFEAGAIQ